MSCFEDASTWISISALLAGGLPPGAGLTRRRPGAKLAGAPGAVGPGGVPRLGPRTAAAPRAVSRSPARGPPRRAAVIAANASPPCPPAPTPAWYGALPTMEVTKVRDPVEPVLLAAARQGDAAAFKRLVSPRRRTLFATAIACPALCRTQRTLSRNRCWRRDAGSAPSGAQLVPQVALLGWHPCLPAPGVAPAGAAPLPQPWPSLARDRRSR